MIILPQKKKMGRPPAENPKNLKFHMRMDNETLEILDICAKKLSSSRSDVIRKGILQIYGDLEQK